MSITKSKSIFLVAFAICVSLTLAATSSPRYVGASSVTYRLAQSEYEATVEIEEVNVIEDRDYGAGEIYLKARIDSGSWEYTDIYANINDGDTLDLNWVVLDDECDSFSLEVEVWESDDGYNEESNDFLGCVEYSRNPVVSTSEWHDAQGSIGGNNEIQAQVYIIEDAQDIAGPDITSPTDITYTEGDTGNVISWTATDPNPGDYEITRNGEAHKTGTWTSNSPITCDVDGFDSGSYTFTLTVYDQEENSASDTVVVTVESSAESTNGGDDDSDGGNVPDGGDTALSITSPMIIAVIGIVAVVIVGGLVAKRDGESTFVERTREKVSLVVCPYCGAKTEQGQSYCSNCGAEL